MYAKTYNVSYDISERPFSDADFTTQGLREYPQGQVRMVLTAQNIALYIHHRFPHEKINDQIWSKINNSEFGFVQIELKAHRGDRAIHRAVSFMEV
jgi:hypothetical protein